MYIYAIIDSTNTCVGVSYLCGEVVQDNMIRIDSAVAETVMGRKYESGEWVQQEIPAPTIQRQEIIAKESELIGDKDIIVQLNDGEAVNSGTLLKFFAPCSCSDFKGALIVDGVSFNVVDALGRDLAATLGTFWKSQAKLSVLLDCENNLAYLQNAAETVQSVVSDLMEAAVDPSDYSVIHISGTKLRYSHGLGIIFFRIDMNVRGFESGARHHLDFGQTPSPTGLYKCWSTHDPDLRCKVQPDSVGFSITMTNDGEVTIDGAVSIFGWFFTE